MVKEIILYSGEITLVDDEDYEYLSQYKWHLSGGYVRTHIKINNKWIKYGIHSLIIDTPKKLKIDHIDGDTLNNQKFNLRIVTHQQNLMNMKSQIGTSKHKGVSWHKASNKWISQIQINKKKCHLGLFINEIDAAKAYNEKAKKLYGEYARLNGV